MKLYYNCNFKRKNVKIFNTPGNNITFLFIIICALLTITERCNALLNKHIT